MSSFWNYITQIFLGAQTNHILFYPISQLYFHIQKNKSCKTNILSDDGSGVRHSLGAKASLLLFQKKNSNTLWYHQTYKNPYSCVLYKFKDKIETKEKIINTKASQNIVLKLKQYFPRQMNNESKIHFLLNNMVFNTCFGKFSVHQNICVISFNILCVLQIFLEINVQFLSLIL